MSIKYTQEQVEWLRKNISYHNNIQKAFNEKFDTNRSEQYIRTLCYRFKIKRYEEQNKWLRENAKGRYLGDILTLFNEKFYPFEMKINTLFHRLENNDIEYKKWHVTEEDICWLKENAKGKKINEITENYNNHFNKKVTPNLIGYLCKSRNIIRFNDKFGADRNSTRNYGTYIFERIGKDNENFNVSYRRKSNIMYEKYHNVKVDDENEIVIHLDNNRNNFDKENLYKLSRKAYKIYNTSRYNNQTLQTKLNALKVSEILQIIKEN